MAFDLVRYNPILSEDKQSVILSSPADETEEDKRLFTEICDELNLEIKDNKLTLTEYRRFYQRVSHVQLEYDLIPDELYSAINHVFNYYLKHPYKKEEIFWNISDNHMHVYDADNHLVEIPRPNHGLAHTLRVASYIPLVIQHVKDHLDPKFTKYYENYTPKKVAMLQLCALFSVVGRKDETGFGTELPGASDVYMGYRKSSAEAFERYCRSHQIELDLTEGEIQHYSAVVKDMGDPEVLFFEPLKLEQLVTHAEGYKLIFVQDETQLEAIQKQIKNENNPNVKPIIIVGNNNKKIVYIYENSDFKTKECTIPDELLKDDLFVTNDHHELIVKEDLSVIDGELVVNRPSVDFAQKIYQLIDPTANVSELKFVYTSSSETMLDNTFLHQAHCMDLYRCREKAEESLIWDKRMFETFCVDDETEKRGFEELIRHPLETIIAMGDRIMDAPITISDTKKRSSKDYDTNIFQIANTNPRFAITRINSLSPRSRYPTEGVLQGPRQKSNATLELEKLIHELLRPHAHYTVKFNKTYNEIEIIVDGNIFNLTKILQHNPDFEQLILSSEQLQAFANMRMNLKLSPFIISINGIPTIKDYRFLDPDNKYAHLHYGEKLAITSYTGPTNYNAINCLLRNGLLSEEQVPLAAEAILIAAIASHGLAKEPSAPPPLNELQILTRKEVYDPYVRDQRMADILAGKLTSQKGFFSTSVNPNPKLAVTTYDVTIQAQQPTAKNPIGKHVQELSYYPHEDEILFPPNTQFQFRIKEIGNSVTSEAIPYRSIQDDSSDSYSVDVMQMRYELMKIRKKLVRLSTKLSWKSDMIVHPFNNFIDGFDQTIINFDLLSSEDKKLHFQKLNYELNALIDYVALTAFKGNIVMMNAAKDDIARIGSSFVVPSPSPDPSWISTICYAAMAGDIEAIKQIQEQNKAIDIKQKFFNGYTLLHIAVAYGQTELVQFLIEAGIPLDQENNYEDSALVLATIKNKLNIVKILLDHKANTIKSNRHSNKTVYHYAQERGLNMLKIFYEKDKENLPLLLANLKNNRGDLILLSYLIMIASINQDNATMPMLMEKWDELGNTSLAKFIYNTADMKEIIELIEDKVPMDNQGNTLLHYLVQNDISFEYFNDIQQERDGRCAIANCLNAKNNVGATPLYLCAKQAYSSGNTNDEKILSSLLKYISSNSSSERKFIAWLSKPEIEKEIKFYLLGIAINNNNRDIVRAIKKSGFMLDHSHAHFIYNVIRSKPSQNSSRIIRLVDQMIAKPKTNIYAEVMLHCKSAEDYTHLLKLSMDNSVDEIANLIFDLIPRDKSLFEILHIAINDGDLDIAEAYLNHYPEYINQKDSYGRTPLKYAILNGNIKMIKLLLENNVNVDIDSLDAGSQDPQIMKLFYEYLRTNEHTNTLIHFIQEALEYHHDTFLRAIYKIAQAKKDSVILNAFSGETFHLQPNETQSMSLHDFKMRAKHRFNLVGIDWLYIAIRMAEALEKFHVNGDFHHDVNLNNFTINPITLEVRLINASEDASDVIHDVYTLAKSIALLFDLPEDPDFSSLFYFIDRSTRIDLLNLLKSAKDETSENTPPLDEILDELYKIKRTLAAADNTVTFGIMNVNDYLESKSNEKKHHRLIENMRRYRKIVLVDTIKRDASIYEMMQQELFDSDILVHNNIFIADSPKQAIEHAIFIINQDNRMKNYFPDFQVIDINEKNKLSKLNKILISTLPKKISASWENDIGKLIKDEFYNFNVEKNIIPNSVQLVTTEMVEEYKELIKNLDNDKNIDKFEHLFERLTLNNVLTDFINQLGDDPQIVYPILKMALSCDNLNIQTSVFRNFSKLAISLVNSLDDSDSSNRLKCEILNLANKENDNDGVSANKFP